MIIFKGWGATAFALAATLLVHPAYAQKQGGILKTYVWDTPPSASIHEEATISTVFPFMPVFNNLVLFDQTKKEANLDTIIPDLGKSWAWDSAKTTLTFQLEQGVKWHDGKPFTAKDVKCTFDLISGLVKSDDFRKNPRKVWYHNVKEITTKGDHEVSFVLKSPQPSFIALLASGYSPVYACHVSQKEMRTNPIGTGPFKVAEIKRSDSIKLTRNPDYWKKGYAPSRRHRVSGHQQPLDAHSRVHRRRGRYDVRVRRHRCGAEGYPGAGAEGGLPVRAVEQHDQHDREFRRAAI